MSKRLFPLSVMIVAGFCLSGCDDSARNFATKTKDILDQRSTQIAGKIAAEKSAYAKQAAHAAEDNRALVDSSLQNERNERSDTLAADYTEGRKPVSLWRKDLADYAKIDYAANREMLAAETDTTSQYLQSFDDLKVEQDKISALSKLLAALAKKPSLRDGASALGSFAEDTKNEFDKKVCKQLSSQKAGSGDSAKAAAKAFGAKGCDEVLKKT